VLSFGAETGEASSLIATAQTLLSSDFSRYLREKLDLGLSFPTARQAALEAMGIDAALLAKPNDILAVEYCKAILNQGSGMEVYPVRRGGDYHDTCADGEDPSATSLRRLIAAGEDWLPFVPAEAAGCFRSAAVHTLEAGERAMLAKLRSMTEEEFSRLPYGSEGLWRKLMHAVRQKATLEEILMAVKSKRYTRTRLDRMAMCAFLGLTAKDLAAPAPYARVLGFNGRGREVLHLARDRFPLYNVGQRVDHPQWAIEQRCNDLYGLFAEAIEPAGMEPKRRVIIRP
jgi:predicted nucleotidyltransferase